MEKSSEAVALRRQLEKAITTENLERISDVLKSFTGVGMTLAMLQESKIGATVSKLKKHEDEGVSNSAKALVKKWKRIVENSDGQGGGSKSEKPEKSSGGKGTGASSADMGKVASAEGMAVVASTAAGGLSAKASSQPLPIGVKSNVGEASSSPGNGGAMSRQSSVLSDTSTDLGAEGALTEEGLAPSRLRMRKKFMETLLMNFAEGDRLAVAIVARGIEDAMNANIPYMSKKDGYLEKARQLVFNLKKNEQLRSDVRENIVAPERLVVMTSTELMDKAKREAMDKAVSDRTEARMLDWADKNADKINKQCGITQTEGMFECGRCKSTKTTYTQKQTRSADEPMTTFVTCTNCKNRWKFC